MGEIKQTCVTCGQEVDFDKVLEEFKELAELANYGGMEALTEQGQVVIEGRCCSQTCYDNMK